MSIATLISILVFFYLFIGIFAGLAASRILDKFIATGELARKEVTLVRRIFTAVLFGLLWPVWLLAPLFGFEPEVRK